MNDFEDDAADELTERYRRASAADPSRPSVQTRAAIAAQARTVMSYRTTRAADEAALARMEASPAANDPRWKLRAVAGLAGVGLAGLLAIQLLRTTPGPGLPRAPIVAETMTLERKADAQDVAALNEVRESASPSAPTAQAMVTAPAAEKKSLGRTDTAPAPRAFPGGEAKSGVQGAGARISLDAPAPPPADEATPLSVMTQALRSTADSRRAESVAESASPAAPATPIATATRPLSQVNAAVRTYFSGGLPISRPPTSVAVFTLFMDRGGGIARSRLEYVVGQSLNQLSQSAATVDRFAALGLAPNQIGRMGTALVSDESDIDVSTLFDGSDPSQRVQDLEKRRAGLLLRFTARHPDVVAVEAALQRMKEIQGGATCCRMVMVAYAWPRIEQ